MIDHDEPCPDCKGTGFAPAAPAPECACMKPGGNPLGNCEVCDPPATSNDPDVGEIVRELRATTPRDSGYAETANKGADAIEQLIGQLTTLRNSFDVAVDGNRTITEALRRSSAVNASTEAELAIVKDILLNPDPDSEPDVIRLHREKCDMFERALAAEARLAEAVEWRPIETAPKDGRAILIRSGNWHTVGSWNRHRGDWCISAPDYPPYRTDERPIEWRPIDRPVESALVRDARS